MPQRLRFSETSPKNFKVESVMGNILGAISFYPQWGRLVYVPLPLTIYTADQLKEITEFIEMKEL